MALLSHLAVSQIARQHKSVMKKKKKTLKLYIPRHSISNEYI